jgi:CxxC motif-containing protein (DUF1111 family)
LFSPPKVLSAGRSRATADHERDMPRPIIRKRRRLKATKKTWVAFSITLAAAAVLLVGTPGRGMMRNGTTTPEAPTGFDNVTIETATDPKNQQHDKDREFFDEVEAITPNGLGPVYNAQSCRECHQNGGPNPGVAVDAVSGGASQVMEIRVGHLGPHGKFEDPVVRIEGDLIVGRTLINDRAICQHAQERTPESEAIRTTRVALNTLGDGFVESVPDEALLAIRNQQCKNAGEVCGVAIWVPLVEAPAMENRRIGRFGWKDEHASLLSFAGDAYLNEMGITNRLQPDEVTQVCNPPVNKANPPPPGDVTEPNSLPDPSDNNLEDIDHFARFMRATKAPPRDRVLASTEAAERGEKLFKRVGCEVCHVRQMVTSPAGTKLNGGTFAITAGLGSKVFHPYSDFLLHDVGTGDGISIAVIEHFGRRMTAEANRQDATKMGLAPESVVDPKAMPAMRDKAAVERETSTNYSYVRPFYERDECDSHYLAEHEHSATDSLFFRDAQCTANKLRTPPLWGLHMRTRLMHDGSSVQLMDAIRRHQGEAGPTTERFHQLSTREQQDLLTFLRSL